MGHQKPQCPVCGSDNWGGEERFEEGNNYKSKIYWRECWDCQTKYDETEIIRWSKDSYGRLTLIFRKSP